MLLVVWVALIFWTFADARRRIDDPMLVGCATLASLFPFVGTIVYAIIRPPEYLDDVRLRELEMQAAEARLTSFDYQLCPYCDYEVKGDYLRCPSCMRRLKERCYSCGKPIDPAWKLCPYCEAETGAVPPPSARRRRRRRHVVGAGSRPSARAASADAPPRLTDHSERTRPMDRTLILVKPDAFARNLTGEIIARFERKGLRIVALTPHDDGHRSSPSSTTPSTTASRSSASSSSFITSGPLVAMVLEGDEAVRAARQVIGATNPLEATTGSIRGDFAVAVGQNMVHGSDSAGVRRARGERCSSPTSDPRLRARPSGGRSSSRRASRSRCGSPASRRRPAATRREVALENARRKAPRGRRAGELVLGADTDVALDGDILGKPRDAAQAARVPRAPLRPHARGRRRRRARRATASVVDGVEAPRRLPRPSTASTVEWYVRYGGVGGPRRRLRDPGPRRGAVSGIEGDYLNVVGLPLARLLELHPDLHPAAPISRGSAEGVR